jgi:hypothetical protein
MPALKSQRQERFCQLLKQGVPAIKAYPMAGYNEHRSAPARLCGNARIKQRLNELTRSLAVKTRVTVESITEELDAVRDRAMATEQLSAAKGAIETKAKLHGLLIDRKESGAPGDFQGDQTMEAVLARVEAELGAGIAVLLRAELAKRDVDAAPRADGDSLN